MTPRTLMTVADLRRLIADLPDDAPVLTEGKRLEPVIGRVASVAPFGVAEKGDPTGSWFERTTADGSSVTGVILISYMSAADDEMEAYKHLKDGWR